MNPEYFAGKQISVAMTVEKLAREIQSDEHYKYLRQKVAGKVQTIYVGEIAKENHNMFVSERGLVMYKGSRFFQPKVLRAGLLKALHMGQPRVLSMVLWAKESV